MPARSWSRTSCSTTESPCRLTTRAWMPSQTAPCTASFGSNCPRNRERRGVIAPT
nr:MAG TPA: hypothetical protein [Caudoviricetes sp.]